MAPAEQRNGPSFEDYRVCVDFSNTAEWRGREKPEELVPTFGHLAEWALKRELLHHDAYHAVLEWAAANPSEAERTYSALIRTREALYRVLHAVATSRRPDGKHLEVVNAAHARVLPRLILSNDAEGFGWEWTGEQHDLEQILAPVMISASALLTSGPVHLLKVCADNTGCAWLFLDMTKNHSRRWCDMKGCGNRAKLRRFNQRKRAQSA